MNQKFYRAASEYATRSASTPFTSTGQQLATRYLPDDLQLSPASQGSHSPMARCSSDGVAADQQPVLVDSLAVVISPRSSFDKYAREVKLEEQKLERERNRRELMGSEKVAEWTRQDPGMEEGGDGGDGGGHVGLDGEAGVERPLATTT